MKHLCSFYTMVNLKMLLRNCVFICFFSIEFSFGRHSKKQLSSLLYDVKTSAPPHKKSGKRNDASFSTYVSPFNVKLSDEKVPLRKFVT